MRNLVSVHFCPLGRDVYVLRKSCNNVMNRWNTLDQQMADLMQLPSVRSHVNPG